MSEERVAGEAGDPDVIGTGDPDAIGTAEDTPADPPAGSEEVQALAGRVLALESELAAKDTELNEAKGLINQQTATNTGLQESISAAVASYRKLAIGSNPIFSEDLITGSTIAEIDASVQKVNGLAAGIKTRIEAELKDTIIPAGAPERSGPDNSGMSPREKIKQGLNK